MNVTGGQKLPGREEAMESLHQRAVEPESTWLPVHREGRNLEEAYILTDTFHIQYGRPY
jgi:hypothetical protein